MATSSPTSPQLASRLALLGTGEKTYDISAEARELGAAKGRKIHDFCGAVDNFASPQSVVRACEFHLYSGRTSCAPAAGVASVRAAIAAHVNRERSIDEGSLYSAENVLVQPGGSPVILKFLLSTMNPGDSVAYPSPGDPAYESIIRMLGGVPRPYGFRTDEETGALTLDMDSLRNAVAGDASLGIEPAKCLIWNDMHNPTGCCATAAEHEQVARIAVDNDLWVLDDESYFQVVYDPKDRGLSIARQDGMRERTVILLTASNAWAMKGWRKGAAVGPESIIEPMVKLAAVDEGCTNHFVQLAVMSVYRDEPRALKQHSLQILAELRSRRDVLVSLLDGVPGFDVPGGAPPKSTPYLWVDVTDGFDMLGIDPSGDADKPTSEIRNDYETFRKRILEETGVAFCTRVHFGDPLPGESRRYARLAFSGLEEDDIRAGVAALGKFMKEQKAKQKKFGVAKDDAVLPPSQ